jgi:hypothetical protein
MQSMKNKNGIPFFKNRNRQMEALKEKHKAVISNPEYHSRPTCRSLGARFTSVSITKREPNRWRRTKQKGKDKFKFRYTGASS